MVGTAEGTVSTMVGIVVTAMDGFGDVVLWAEPKQNKQINTLKIYIIRIVFIVSWEFENKDRMIFAIFDGY